MIRITAELISRKSAASTGTAISANCARWSSWLGAGEFAKQRLQALDLLAAQVKVFDHAEQIEYAIDGAL